VCLRQSWFNALGSAVALLQADCVTPVSILCVISAVSGRTGRQAAALFLLIQVAVLTGRAAAQLLMACVLLVVCACVV
jgi:hypothetical protein